MKEFGQGIPPSTSTLPRLEPLGKAVPKSSKGVWYTLTFGLVHTKLIFSVFNLLPTFWGDLTKISEFLVPLEKPGT